MNQVVLFRVLLIVFLLWSVICLYIALRYPDLPKRIMNQLAGIAAGGEVEEKKSYTNLGLLWFFPFFFLALWIAFEFRLKDLLS